MNELNTKTHDLDYSKEVASIDLEQLLTSSLPPKQLAPLVRERVKLAITQFAQSAPISSLAGDTLDAKNEMRSLYDTVAIPLPPELCTLMARVGFDKALFTYGNVDGAPVGFAEAMWLLKFVEITEKEPSRHREEPWFPACARASAGNSSLSASSTT